MRKVARAWHMIVVHVLVYYNKYCVSSINANIRFYFRALLLVLSYVQLW